MVAIERKLYKNYFWAYFRSWALPLHYIFRELLGDIWFIVIRCRMSSESSESWMNEYKNQES